MSIISALIISKNKMTKTITKQFVVVVTIAGLLFGASVAHAGFFDWFNQTPLNQEAQALKSVKVEDSKDSKSLFDRLFGASSNKNLNNLEENPFPVEIKGNSEPFNPNPTPQNRVDNSGTVFNPIPDPVSNALVISCGSSMTVAECEEFCWDIGGTADASGGGGCLVDNPDSTALAGGNVGTVFDPNPELPGNALIIQCGPTMSAEECEDFCVDIGGNPSASSTGNCVVDNPEDTALTTGPGTVFGPDNPGEGRVIFYPNGTCKLEVIEPITGQVVSSATGTTVYNQFTGGRACNTQRLAGDGIPFPANDDYNVYDIVHNDDGTCTVDLVEPVSGNTITITGDTVRDGIWLLCSTDMGDFRISPKPSHPVMDGKYQFDERIDLGQNGPEVVKLQNALKSLGYYNGAADGIYGRGTSAAVKSFQRANGQIFTTGDVVGPKTREALNEALSKNPVRSNVSSKSKAQVLQDVFGPDFSNARYQVDCKLTSFPYGSYTMFVDADPSGGNGEFSISNSNGEVKANCKAKAVE
jgi:hypothetical protein